MVEWAEKIISTTLKKTGVQKRVETVIKNNCSFCLLNNKYLCVILHPVQILTSKIYRLLQLKNFSESNGSQ